MKPALRPQSFDALDVRSSAAALTQAHRSSSDRLNPPDQRTKLERNYPGIANAIRLLWGHPEMNEYFDKLWLADERSEPIDPEVMADLMLLARVHQELLPVRPKHTQSTIYGRAYGDWSAKQDIWGSAPRVR